MGQDLIGYVIAGGLICMGVLIHLPRKRKPTDSEVPSRRSKMEQ